MQLTDDFIGLHGSLVGFHQHLHVTLPSFELMLDIEQMDKTCTREMDSPIVGWFDRHFLSVKAIFFC